MDAIVYIVLETDVNIGNSSYGNDAPESVWTDLSDAEKRAGQLRQARVVTFKVDVDAGWLE